MKKGFRFALALTLLLVLCLPTSAWAAKEKFNRDLTVTTSLNQSTYEVTVTWSAVEGAKSYTVYLKHRQNNSTGYYQDSFPREVDASAERKTVYTAASFATPEHSGPDEWMVKVYAQDAVGNDIESGSSAAFSVNMPTLDTPVPTLSSSGIASWNAVSGANSYHYTLYGRSGSSGSGNKITTGATSNLSTDFSSEMSEGYSYRVELHATDPKYLHVNSETADSGWVVYAPMTSIGDPTNLRWEGKTAKWNAVANADGYKVFLRGFQTFDTKEPKLDFSAVEDDFLDGRYFTVTAYAGKDVESHNVKGPAYKAPEQIKSVDLTVAVPNPGETPEDVAPTVSTPNVSLYAYDWMDENGKTMSKKYGVFEAGKTYQLVAVVSSATPFASSATATVNGANAQAERQWDDYNLRITTELPVGAAPTAEEVQILISIVEKVDLSKVKISLTTDKGITETTGNIVTKTLNATKGSEIEVKAEVKEGYKFARWEITDFNTGDSYDVTEQTYKLKADKRLLIGGYFTSENAQTFTIAFDANGGTGNMDHAKVNQDAAYTLPSSTFTAPKGKVFDKWDAGAAGATITVTGNMTVKALWKDAKAPVTITFDAGGGTGTMTAATVNKGDTYVLPANSFTAPEGKEFDKWDKGAIGASITVNENTTVTAQWKDKAAQPQPQSQTPKANPFTDVPDNADYYYYEPILWAYYHEPQITTGTSADTFDLWRTCDRAQVVTFLWRAYGCPEPKSATTPFTDLTQDWYKKAVQWAVEQGITNGTSDTTFSPEKTCSVAEVITFLNRAAGSPGSGGEVWYSGAMNWAKTSGLVQNTSWDGSDPLVNCPRADIVTYLYRQFGK